MTIALESNYIYLQSTGYCYCYFISSRSPAGAAAVERFSQSSSESEDEEVERCPRSTTDLSPALWKTGLILHGRPLSSTSTRNSDLNDSCSTPDREFDIQKPLHNLFDSHNNMGEKNTSDQLKWRLWDYFIGKYSLTWLVGRVDSWV